ncbi:MAG TPA: hypothetical protein VFK43_03815, partial [Acidimicrobiales bacterium]|nr:hypothetical protein [Acidimicrobiales bacterium]
MNVLALVVALAGAYGVFLLYTALVLEWRGLGVGDGRIRSQTHVRARTQQWLAQAGLEGVSPGEFLTVMAVLFVVGTGLTFAVLGAPLPALAVGAFAATYPVASYRARRQH